MLNNKAYKALAHPVRRDILKRLREGPMSAGDLADTYNMSKPSLSTHFKVLRTACLIQAERRGNHIFYRLNVGVADEMLAAVMDMFGIEKGEQT
jgi:DNA-binding transcriptional ArsR family regulator